MSQEKPKPNPKITSLAPCGLICDLCLGFQRTKNRCDGCNSLGNKPGYCTTCRIRNCEPRKENPLIICYDCDKYPCRRLKDLNKRYTLRYGESLIENFQIIKTRGLEEFLMEAGKKWTCSNCGELLCVHRPVCLGCGEKNPYYPDKESEAGTTTR